MGGEWFTRRRPPHKLAGNSLLMAGRAEREREAKKNDDLMLEIEEQFKNSKKNQALHLSPPSTPENETAGAPEIAEADAQHPTTDRVRFLQIQGVRNEQNGLSVRESERSECG